MTVLVGYQAFKLIVERMALHIEFSHHGRAIDILGELELKLTLFLSSSHLISTQDLMPDLVILLVRIGRDGVFDVCLAFSHLRS